MQPKKALVVRGGWEGHRPVQATELFLPFLESSGFTVRVEESTEVYADAAELARTDLVVQCISMSEISAEQVAGLSTAVAAGTDLTAPRVIEASSAMPLTPRSESMVYW